VKKPESFSSKYIDADFIIEGVLARPALGQDTPLDTADKWSGRMKAAIAEVRSMGLSEEEIEYSIRLNLRTYGFDDSTFPIEEWL